MIREELEQLEEQYEKEVVGIVKKSNQLLRSRYGLWILGAITFVDSALAFPGPIDPFLAAYIVADRRRVWLGFLVTVATSVLGGVMLYLFAAFFTEQILGLLSAESVKTFNEVVASFDQGTFMISFLGAFTPIPYGIVVIVAGALKGNIFMFIAGSLLGRALRFGIVAYLSYRYGNAALELAKKHILLVSVIAAIMVGAYLAFSFL
jgi:membrane protein YqaA with SNARE-associated domain